MILKIYILILIALALRVCSSNKISCRNGGRPILTRTPIKPFNVQYKCLCPFNFFGNDCNEYRQVLCYISKSNKSKYHPYFSESVKFSFEMQCFLKKLQFVDGKFLQTGNVYQLPINSSTAYNDQWENNYYIDPSLQIIWANRSSLFDEDGNLIRTNVNDTRSDQQILDSYPKYSFDYPSQFFGVPYSSTQFVHNITNIKYRNSSQSLGSADVQFQLQSQLPIAKNILGSFQLKINQQWFQYQVALISLQINQYYGDHKALTHTSMNSASWRIYDPNYTRGTQLGPTHSIPTSVWVILATFIIWGMVMSGKYVSKLRKQWKINKNRQQDGV